MWCIENGLSGVRTDASPILHDKVRQNARLAPVTGVFAFEQDRGDQAARCSDSRGSMVLGAMAVGTHAFRLEAGPLRGG